MSEIEQEDWLDRQLREAAPYIDDAGFVARVMQKLPPPRPRREWMRAIILLGITLLASVLAYIVSDGGRFIAVAIERLSMLPMLWILVIAITSGILILTGGIAAALNQSRALER